MYFGTPLFNGGHESAGVTAPSTTGSSRKARPARSSRRSCCSRIRATADANVTLHVPAGERRCRSTKTQRRCRRARAGRSTSRTEDPSLRERGGRDARHVGRADRRRARAVLAVHAGSAGTKRTTASASPRPASKWGLAEGRVGGPSATIRPTSCWRIPATTPANVTITFLRDEAARPWSRPSRWRPTLAGSTSDVDAMVPELANESFGAVIDVRPAGLRRARDVFERQRRVLGGGHDATATALP